MKKIEKIKTYFYYEIDDLEITNIKLVETTNSYLYKIECYLINTDKNKDFYVFYGDTFPMNLYPVKEGETLNECLYKHIGFMSELCSKSVEDNFIVDFVKQYSIFPILDRKLGEIYKVLSFDKNASQLSGVANQIRDCYLNLSDYLMNKTRTKNPNYKNDNFTDNLQEFLTIILPGSQSETRRNVINGIAKKGWTLNSELIHKDSVTVFDIFISINIFQLVVSTVSNLIVGNNMPFNRIKCPHCNGEEYTMKKIDNEEKYEYVCSYCKTHFKVSIDEIIKDI